MPPTISSLRAWSVRDFVTSSQSGSEAHRSGVGSSGEQQETGCRINQMCRENVLFEDSDDEEEDDEEEPYYVLKLLTEMVGRRTKN